MWYVCPNFSFGVILLDFYIKDGAKTILNLNVGVAWACLTISIPAYLALYAYMDAILPNTFGIRESCCFCCRKRKHVDFEDEEDGESVLKRSLVEGSAIKMDNLSKHYG